MSISFILALLLLGSAASANQDLLVPTDTLAETDLQEALTYQVTLYYDGTSDDECFLSDGDEGDGKGLLFTESGWDNLCLTYKNGDVYLKAYYSKSSTYLIRIGDGTFSVQAEYKPYASPYKITFRRGEDESIYFISIQAEKIDASMLLSVQEAKDDYGSAYALDISWMVDLKDNDAYQLEVTVSKGSTECITPTMGRLEGVEMCLEFSSTKILTIYADDVEVGVYEDEVTGTKINFLYQNVDDFCYITRSGSTQSLFYVLSSQVFWIRDEGEIEENDNNMVYDLELVNGADTSDGYSYSCINMYNPSSTDSVLYQQIQIVCGECNEDADYCALKVYIRDGKSQTISAFRYLTDDESLEIEYDGTIEMLTYSYNKIGFELFADELVVYQLEGNNGFEYRPLIGDINFESDGDDADYEADWTAETGEIQEIALNSDGVDVVMDVYCDDDACYLGAQSTNSNTFDVYKEYTGNFDTVSVYYIDDEEDQETCLSFSNDDYTLNHCGFYSQWEMYYHTFSLYPVDTIELTD